MFRNYLKIALRNILKYKGYSFINIAGLALGLACSILIFLWVLDELSYDRFHQKADLIYRVEENQYYSGERFHVMVTPYPAAPTFKQDIPEITDATRVSWGFGMLLRYQDQALYQNDIRAVDPSFLDIFSFEVLRGDAATALTQPYSAVITEETATKYFGDEDPIGKVLSANNKYDFVVTAVIADVPHNSSLDFTMLVPFDFTRDLGWYNDHWDSNSILSFVQLRQESEIEAINQKMTEIVHSHVEESKTEFVLASLTGIHLYTHVGYGTSMGNVQYVYIFSVVAVFVLLLACINFMNLSTARSANRAREIGIRKVSGALRLSVAWQFLSESLIFAFCALALALSLVGLFLPQFNQLAGKEISLSNWADPKIILGLIGITALTGLIAGSYPAMFLSSFKPVSVLKGSINAGAKSTKLRKTLVILQFALSVFLMIGTTVVFQQLHYMKNKSLGYEKEHVIYIPMRGDISKSYETLRAALKTSPDVLGVTGTVHRPGMIGSNSGGANWPGKDPQLELLVSQDGVDYDFVSTMKIEMAAGRDFSTAFPSDVATDSTGAFLVNQRFAEIIGLDPIVGTELEFGGRKGPIVGVVKDFHYSSVRVPIEPLAVALEKPEDLNNMAIRLGPGDVSERIAGVREAWNRVVPNFPFDFRFLDQEIDKLYRAEESMVDILRYFTIFAIIVSCLGLFGLASFMAVQRTREIGVRKVLGASVSNIVLLLSREFAIWVVVANLIAWPIAFLAMQNWLEKFAYRIELGWGLFLLAGTLALAVALLTVSGQAIRSALTNPAEALHYE